MPKKEIDLGIYVANKGSFCLDFMKIFPFQSSLICHVFVSGTKHNRIEIAHPHLTMILSMIPLTVVTNPSVTLTSEEISTVVHVVGATLAQEISFNNPHLTIKIIPFLKRTSPGI